MFGERIGAMMTETFARRLAQDIAIAREIGQKLERLDMDSNTTPHGRTVPSLSETSDRLYGTTGETPEYQKPAPKVEAKMEVLEKYLAEELATLKGEKISEPERLTQERKSQHGDWLAQSYKGNRLKAELRGSPNWARMPAHQQEALDMIVTKISRILTGDPDHPDHWDDIGGYAHLGKGGHSS